MVRSVIKFWRGSRRFWILIVFLALTFLMGGGARSDISSLIILRPTAVFFCFIGFWSLRLEHVQANRFLFGMAFAVFALVIIHLIPLPSAVWHELPGRAIIIEVDKAAQLGAVWRPISMVPSATWNAFFSLFVPLAVLLLGVQLNREELFKLLPVLLGLGLISGFSGILQISGSPDGLFYLYDITNNGSAVGLFSNRNHQALFLASLFPMLAIYASNIVKSEEQVNVRIWLAIAAGAVLVPLLLVTGSRAGLFLGIIGLISIGLVYNRPAFLTSKKRKTRSFNYIYLFGAFGVLCLAALTVIMSRAEAFQRLFTSGQSEDGRFEMWSAIGQMAWKYFPFGSGLGSFVEVYEVDEPYALLSPSYANHAHNDWLELYMTAGLPALTLLAISIIAFVKLSWNALRKPMQERRGERYTRLGIILIAILALGSVTDYPLRVPSLSCVFVIAILWLTCGDAAGSKSTGSV